LGCRSFIRKFSTRAFLSVCFFLWIHALLCSLLLLYQSPPVYFSCCADSHFNFPALTASVRGIWGNPYRPNISVPSVFGSFLFFYTGRGSGLKILSLGRPSDFPAFCSLQPAEIPLPMCLDYLFLSTDLEVEARPAIWTMNIFPWKMLASFSFSPTWPTVFLLSQHCTWVHPDLCLW